MTNVNKCSGIVLLNLYLPYPAIGTKHEQTRRTYAAISCACRRNQTCCQRRKSRST